MVLEQWYSYRNKYRYKNETRPLSHVKHKSQLQVDFIAKCERQDSQICEEKKKREYLYDLKIGKYSLNRSQMGKTKLQCVKMHA